MKDYVEIGHLTKYDAFRVNRDQAMNLEIWFKIHTNVSNFLVVRLTISGLISRSLDLISKSQFFPR